MSYGVRLARALLRFAPLLVFLGGCEGSDLPTDQAFTRPSTAAIPDAGAPKWQESYTDWMSGRGEEREVACRPVLPLSDPMPYDEKSIPARYATTIRPSTAALVEVFTDDLVGQFRTHCGTCHIDDNQGSFRISGAGFNLQDKADSTYAERLRLLTESVKRMRSNDLGEGGVMPPVSRGGKAFKDRAAGDPLVEFASLLEAWLQAGGPAERFFATKRSNASGSPYLLAKGQAQQMTNLGNCIPGQTGFAAEEKRSAELDRMFEQATSLPLRLEQTDLFTLDSQTLVSYGVVAFAPGYTLWADNAKKQRYIRVPRGKSIVFDKDTQSFAIPPNTRFYKTFLRKVKDKEGKVTYRKIETRLIVTRPDDDTKSGHDRPRALFGTYAWNEDESEAVLVTDPLRNGKPFRDRLVRYALDEQKVEKLLETGDPDAPELSSDDVRRTHAIPGSSRCLNCHMGAPGKDFVLGFLPLQIKRRPKGEGGVIEESAPDELNQLSRLIEYGVITGVQSEADILPLEQSQGVRKPRNDYELAAQGYMLGNCAHCHNPRGFPSFAAPELEKVLNFLPDTQAGGVFQFSLDTFSPRVKRGKNVDKPIPYITPSLYDLPFSHDSFNSYGAPTPDVKGGFTQHAAGKVILAEAVDGEGNVAQVVQDVVYAPWRSLIYRNVDAPFTYEEDNANFVRMPRDTAGYDCRTRQIFGSWMASIPAKLKTGFPAPNPADANAALVRSRSLSEMWFSPLADPVSGAVDVMAEAQPYEEVLESDPRYLIYQLQAEDRVKKFNESLRIRFCPDSKQDIVDPKVASAKASAPGPEEQRKLDPPQPYPVVPGQRVPARAHYATLDLTDPVDVGWRPRREDWKNKLVDLAIPAPVESPDKESLERNANDRVTLRVLTGIDPWTLEGTTLVRKPRPTGKSGVLFTQAFRDFALKDVPFGVWAKKHECSYAGAPKLADFAASRPRWMEEARDLQPGAPGYDPAAAIYTISPGAQLYTTICVNCHGPEADSRGRMADLTADLTGGQTRVANFIDGLFGPRSNPGENRTKVFSTAGAAAVTAEDWAARYLAWMGLGGTAAKIPPSVLTVVNITPVLGRQRIAGLGGSDANMLSLAERICSYFLQPDAPFDIARGVVARDKVQPSGTAFVPVFANNGDEEMWEQLCGFDNLAPVKVIDARSSDGKIVFDAHIQGLYLPDSSGDIDRVGSTRETNDIPRPMTIIRRHHYPANAPVGDNRGRVHSALNEQNVYPWCILRPDPSLKATMEDVRRAFREARNGDAAEPPWCPENVLTHDNALPPPGGEYPTYSPEYWQMSRAERVEWGKRGAINAGMAVFSYMDALAKGSKKKPVPYDRCELLK